LREGDHLRIHVLGLIGAVLGLTSLILPWLTVTSPTGRASGTAFEVFDLIGVIGPAFQASPGLGIVLLVVAVLLAVIGTVVSVFHPVGGGFLVAAGICGTIGAIWLRQTFSVLPGASASLNVGVIVALVAGTAALGGYGIPRLALWPRPATESLPPPKYPASAEPPPPSIAANSRALPPPPPPPPAHFLSSIPVSPGISASEPGWVVQLDKEIRGVEEAIVAERTSLSRIDSAVANGEIDSPTYAELSSDHSARIAALERHLAKKRGERERGEEPPPPPD
jgi:hypothetical protein